MDDLEQTTTVASRRWVATTLEAFRREAEKEMNGTAYEAVRPSTSGVDEPRLFLIICVTGEHELSLTKKYFDLRGVSSTRAWSMYTLADMLLDTQPIGGLSYQDLTVNSKRVAVVLCASRPDKVLMLEQIFGLTD